jgi:4a-hydroxytetrahydrobiopterin dehydratase
MARLTDGQIDEALGRLDGWTRQGSALVKTLTFPSFPDGVAWLVRLAFEAEAADHHPDVTISYRRLTLSYSTHSEGGVTQKDIDGAMTADRLFRAAAVERSTTC